MSDKDLPAFPSTKRIYRMGYATAEFEPVAGMNLRQYAAIKLKVPDSGAVWLDDMITKSLRDDFTAKALAVAWDAYDKGYTGDPEDSTDSIVKHAYQLVDAIMKAREL